MTFPLIEVAYRGMRRRSAVAFLSTGGLAACLLLGFGCTQASEDSSASDQDAGGVGGAAGGGAAGGGGDGGEGDAVGGDGGGSAGAAGEGGGAGMTGGLGGGLPDDDGPAGGSGGGGPDAGAGGETPPASKDLVWIDETLTFNAHSKVITEPPPPDWYAPTNYFDGEIRTRLVVTSKPTSLPVWAEICFWQDRLGGRHVCMAVVLPPWSTTGTYTYRTKATAIRFLDQVDFSKPFAVIEHRLKDGTGKLRGDDLGDAHLPLQVRYTVVLVPKGETFAGWEQHP